MGTDCRVLGTRYWILGVCAAVFLLCPALARAQEADDVATLRKEIEEMKNAYEDRISALEKRLAELETAPAPQTPQPSTEDEELAALRAAAEEMAGQTPSAQTETAAGAPAPTPPSGGAGDVSFGSERNLNRLNPEISMTGDLVGFATDQGREDFDGREFELNVQSRPRSLLADQVDPLVLARRGSGHRRRLRLLHGPAGRADAHRRQVPPGVRRS